MPEQETLSDRQAQAQAETIRRLKHELGAVARDRDRYCVNALSYQRERDDARIDAQQWKEEAETQQARTGEAVDELSQTHDACELWRQSFHRSEYSLKEARTRIAMLEGETQALRDCFETVKQQRDANEFAAVGVLRQQLATAVAERDQLTLLRKGLLALADFAR